MIRKVMLISVALGIAYFGVALLPNQTCVDDVYAVICFKSGKQVSGMNKICYYNCLGSTAAITISITTICPLSIQN
jgi:hypothetical protein